MSTGLKQMQMFCEKIFAKYTKEKCWNCCSHVKPLEEEYWQWDSLMEEAVDSMIIPIGENLDYMSSDAGEF
jgi:hypothetical protein